MKVKISVFACLLTMLILMTGCNAPDGESGASSQAASGGGESSFGGEEDVSSASQTGAEASSDQSEWTAYIDDAHQLCIQKKDGSEAKVLVKDVAAAACVAEAWVYYLPNLDEIDKVKLDGSQITKVCSTDAFQVYNANLDIYHEINGSTSVTANYQDGYILYTCVQLKQEEDARPNPPSYYRLDLDKNTLTQLVD
ncbi:DUF5050 domain-containing protein [Oscillibacter sp.]|uniref:DUF5050 domain-containing protein n=1 Tax=Oscillibacter sp. TaxID=1945593 RepID=UPI0028995393|nr:DUF5050 domain-containing protein [Oscillibacter sp.]